MARGRTRRARRPQASPRPAGPALERPPPRAGQPARSAARPRAARAAASAPLRPRPAADGVAPRPGPRPARLRRPAGAAAHPALGAVRRCALPARRGGPLAPEPGARPRGPPRSHVVTGGGSSARASRSGWASSSRSPAPSSSPYRAGCPAGSAPCSSPSLWARSVLLALAAVVVAGVTAVAGFLAGPTVAAEDSDAFDAVSRTFTYASHGAAAPRRVAPPVRAAACCSGTTWRFLRMLAAGGARVGRAPGRRRARGARPRARHPRGRRHAGGRRAPRASCAGHYVVAFVLALAAGSLVILWLADLVSRVCCARMGVYLLTPPGGGPRAAHRAAHAAASPGSPERGRGRLHRGGARRGDVSRRRRSASRCWRSSPRSRARGPRWGSARSSSASPAATCGARSATRRSRFRRPATARVQRRARRAGRRPRAETPCRGDDLVGWVRRSTCRRGLHRAVTITGGEPLLHPEVVRAPGGGVPRRGAGRAPRDRRPPAGRARATCWTSSTASRPDLKLESATGAPTPVGGARRHLPAAGADREGARREGRDRRVDDRAEIERAAAFAAKQLPSAPLVLQPVSEVVPGSPPAAGRGRPLPPARRRRRAPPRRAGDAAGPPDAGLALIGYRFGPSSGETRPCARS